MNNKDTWIAMPTIKYLDNSALMNFFKVGMSEICEWEAKEAIPMRYESKLRELIHKTKKDSDEQVMQLLRAEMEK